MISWSLILCRTIRHHSSVRLLNICVFILLLLVCEAKEKQSLVQVCYRCSVVIYSIILLTQAENLKVSVSLYCNGSFQYREVVRAMYPIFELNRLLV